MTTIPEIFENFDVDYFKIGLSGVRLHVAGSLVDFDFVCWCSQVPARYALSVTANG